MNKLLPSLVLLFTWLFTLAQAPTGLSGVGYRTTVHLKWDNYTAFTPVGYNIYRSTVSNSFGTPARRIGAYKDYTDYGLSPGTTYYYKLAAFDAAGNESALTSQITVSTNNNNYLKVANLDLLIPIYTGGMGPNEPNDIRQELEVARQFYFRNTKGQLNLKFHFMEIPGYPPPNNDGVADFGTIGTDLHNRGIVDNQYDAIHVEAYQTYGYWGGAMWLGQTAGSMAHQPAWYYDPTNHYTTGDAWVFTHEFGHSLDGIIAGGSGFPEMIFNHFPWAFPLPTGIENFDAGPDYDGMALVLRLFNHHLDYAAPWDGYFEVTDADGDKLADNDSRLPFDEVRFGSSPATDDSDLDGLNDLKEFHAGIYSGSNPTNPDTDGDGIPDGTDPYPISNFKSSLQKTSSPVTVNGTMGTGEGWQPLVSNPFYSKSPGTTLNAFATWDDTYLYFAFQSNTQLKYYLYLDGSGQDGLFAAPIRFPGGNYNDMNAESYGDSYYENAVPIIRSDATQVFLKNVAVPGSLISTVLAGGIYTTEVRIPHNLGPGFGYTYTPPTAPVVTTQSYTNGSILGINLVALPLANANGNEPDDWRLSNMISMNEPFHLYDVTLTGDTPPPASYCASTSNFPWEDWIAKVKVGTIDNASSKSKYSDFTNLTTNLTYGNNPVELTTGFSYFTWDEYWRVWVDLNHDGDFDDAGEVVLEQIKTAPPAGTTTSTLNSNIFISPSALTGSTRMRVSMKRGAYPLPCETLPFGEVEDYTVNIQQPPALANLYFPYFEFIPGGTNQCYLAGSGGGGGGVVNNGTTSAGPFKVKVYFSKDQQYGPEDVLWKEFSYNGLASNDFVGFSVTASSVPPTLPLGKYYVVVVLDPDNSVAESNESDNLYVTGAFNNGAPDFVISSATGVPVSATAGSSLNLIVKTTNLIAFPFAELTTPLEAKVYLSVDDQNNSPIYGGGDLEIGSAVIPFNQFTNAPLYLNGEATINVQAVIPAGTAADNYFIFVQLGGACEQSLVNSASLFFPIQITTGGTPGVYCQSFSNFPWEDWIAKVKLGTINNASGKSTYSDFTGISTTLQKGVAIPIELTTGYSYFTFNEYWRVWIDFNHDGVFSTPDELVQQQILTAPANGTATATITGSVNVPQGALTGPTRMRVSMKRGAYPTACETLPFGEVEDYTVNITASTGCSPDVTPPVISGCPGNISVTSAAPLAVTWTPPTATDNCTTPTLTSSHQPGAVFPFGTTTVTYTAKDAANNMANCTFTVTVTQVVTNLPDLVLTNLQAPASGTTGSVVNFSFKLNNIGTAAAAGDYVIGAYLSTDNAWSSNDVLAGIVPTGNTPVNFNTTVPASITVPAGTAPGSYFLIVLADKDNVIQESNENNNTVSAAFQVTGIGPVTYCNSSSSFPWEEWIAGVQLANLNKTSGKSAYSDFTSSSANVQAGNSYPITLTTGFSYFTWDEYWRVWIDFNRDGVFSTPDEVVQQRILTAPAAGTPTASVTGNVSIPAWVTEGPTRMRVSMKRGAYPTSCETLPFGEVEDYTVNITSGGPGCSVTISYSNLQCQDNNTPLDPFDDGFTFDLMATGSGSGTNWLMTWNGGSTTGTFGVQKKVGPFSIATYQNVFNFTVADAAQPSCSATGSLVPPPPCSVPPSVCGFSKTYQSGANFTGFYAEKTPGGFKVIGGKPLMPTGITFITLNTNQDGVETGAFTQNVSAPQSQAPVWLRDGNYLFLSATADFKVKLEKRSAGGTSIWTMTYSIQNADATSPFNAIEGNNGEIYVTGAVDDSPSGTAYKLFTLKTNSAGVQQWLTVHTLQNDPFAFFSKGLKPTQDGGYVVYATPGNVENFIVRIGGTGNILWSKKVSSTPLSPIWDATESSDGSILVSYVVDAPTGPSPANVFFAKLTTSGSVAWEKFNGDIIGNIPNPLFIDYHQPYVAPGPNAGFTVAFSGPGGLYFGGLSSSGTVLWTKNHAFTPGIRFMTRVNDGGYLLTGNLNNELWLMKTDAQGNICETPPPPANYCASTSNFPWEDWIARVKLSTLDNSSGKSPYSDFTALSTTLQKGTDYEMTLTTGFSYFTWNEYWNVWIDLNHDGIFQNPGELVLAKILNAPPAGTATASITGTFKLPTSALPGPTRMRVSMKRNNGSTPCETLPFGEVEDYTVNIVTNLKGDGTEDRTTSLGFEAVAKMASVQLYGAYSQPTGVEEAIFEKSTDGIDYQPIERFKGKQSATLNSTDVHPVEGFNFYRMALLLPGGQVQHSPVRVVSFSSPLDFTVFPNPASSEIYIALKNRPESEMTWSINDAYGRLVWSRETGPEKEFPLFVNVGDLEEGMYFLYVVRPGQKAVVRKFLITR